MDKKFYEAPEMEVMELELKTSILEVSGGSPEFGGEGSDDDF